MVIQKQRRAPVLGLGFLVLLALILGRRPVSNDAVQARAPEVEQADPVDEPRGLPVTLDEVSPQPAQEAPRKLASLEKRQRVATASNPLAPGPHRPKQVRRDGVRLELVGDASAIRREAQEYGFHVASPDDPEPEDAVGRILFPGFVLHFDERVYNKIKHDLDGFDPKQPRMVAFRNGLLVYVDL